MKALKKGFDDGRHDNASSIGGFEGGRGGALPPQVVVLEVKHTMSMCSALPACAALCQPVQRFASLCSVNELRNWDSMKVIANYGGLPSIRKETEILAP